MKRFGEKLRTLRKQQGLTQTELATILGTNQSHVGKLEKGTRSPSVEVLMQIMQIFKVSCDQLLMDEREVD